MRVLLAVALALASLGGCAVYTPSGAVIVDPANVPGGGPGGFCPPGQAKKGRC
jgi:hypothetical protein